LLGQSKILSKKEIHLLVAISVNGKKSFPHFMGATSGWGLGVVGSNIFKDLFEGVICQLAQGLF